MKNQDDILIMGVGNVLLGDEGVGVHFIDYLKKKSLPDNITILDGGTGGFHLLNIIHEYNKMVIIDASTDHFPVGNVRLIKPKFSKDFPNSLTTHDIGLKDLIETALVLEKIPEIYLVVITIDTNQTVGLMLSEEIKQKLPEIELSVNKALNIFNKQTHSGIETQN